MPLLHHALVLDQLQLPVRITYRFSSGSGIPGEPSEVEGSLGPAVVVERVSIDLDADELHSYLSTHLMTIVGRSDPEILLPLQDHINSGGGVDVAEGGDDGESGSTEENSGESSGEGDSSLLD